MTDRIWRQIFQALNFCFEINIKFNKKSIIINDFSHSFNFCSWISTRFAWLTDCSKSQRGGSQKASAGASLLWYKVQSWKIVWFGKKWKRILSGNNQPVDQQQIWAVLSLHFFLFSSSYYYIWICGIDTAFNNYIIYMLIRTQFE